MVKTLKRILTGTLAVGVAFMYPTTKALAQNVTLDGTLGTPETLTAPNYQIPQSVGETIGNNLFHSFGKFNLNSNEAAIFESAGNIRNILSRVTGGNPSSIDGLIRTLGSDVNFFLINPSGIIFGENARLDITGSFVGSTANAIQFANQGFFSATNLQPPSQLLTINPSALFFNQLQPGTIESKSNLRVPNNRSLLLVGGDINLDGGELNANGGRLELTGLVGNGTVGLNINGNDLSLSVPDDIARANVSLTNGAIIDVSAGGGGSITVNAQNLEMREESQLLAGIRSDLGTPEAQAGDITINATDTVLLDDNSFIFNDINFGGVGNAGNVSVNTGSLEVTNGAALASDIAGEGNGGNVTINATSSVKFDGEDKDGFNSGAFSTVLVLGKGNAGDVSITTASLEVTNGALVNASTRGEGNGGNVTINATEFINFDGEGKDGGNSAAASQVEPGAIGNGGDVSITTRFFKATNEAQISANTNGVGNAGSVTINATDSIELDGESTVTSLVNFRAVGNGANVLITTDSLEVTNGAILSTLTRGEGNAGNITINATEFINFDGKGKRGFSSGAFSGVSNSGSVGKGGDISITTNSLEVTNTAQLAASTSSSQKAGDILLNSDRLTVAGGGKILARTFSSGEAGDITLNVNENITITGSETGIFASTLENSTGNGGSIIIDPKIMTIRDGARIAVDSQGEGIGGDIELAAGFLTLDKGIISAETRSNTGGNINLNLQDVLLLRNESQISTTAGFQQFGGDGGNISINVPNGFIIALPNENSDITANAFSGSGGEITIDANNIFGIAPLTRDELIQQLGTDNPQELNPNSLPSSNITAISQQNPNLNGDFTITDPDIDPNRGLIELPENLVDASQQIAQACTGGRQQQSTFIATGRGGLPLSPNEPLRERAVITNWVDLPSQTTERRINKLPTASATPSTPKIIEAQKIVVDQNGDTYLVAESPQIHTFLTISCN